MQDHAASQAANIPPELHHPDKLTAAAELEVALLIAMPTPHRQTAVPGHTITSGSLKGKEKRLDGYWDELEEGVPDVVIGVARLPFSGTDDG